MFKVIYISTSCKQASEFIDRLMWDLRKYEIYDIEIDTANSQLRTDKFIVLAVDIFSGRLRSNHHMTEYFIDKVSDADYPNERAKENALGLLKRLKCSFREGTKEISEEELIKILMEASDHE